MAPTDSAAGKAGTAQPLRGMARHAGQAERLLRALASRHRLMVLCALAEGELSVGALNDRVPLSQSALSQHLAVLRADGLVNTRRDAQTIFYSVPEGAALEIIRVLHSAYCCTPATRRRTNIRTPRSPRNPAPERP